MPLEFGNVCADRRAPPPPPVGGRQVGTPLPLALTAIDSICGSKSGRPRLPPAALCPVPRPRPARRGSRPGRARRLRSELLPPPSALDPPAEARGAAPGGRRPAEPGRGGGPAASRAPGGPDGSGGPRSLGGGGVPGAPRGRGGPAGRGASWGARGWPAASQDPREGQAVCACRVPKACRRFVGASCALWVGLQIQRLV